MKVTIVLIYYFRTGTARPNHERQKTKWDFPTYSI